MLLPHQNLHVSLREYKSRCLFPAYLELCTNSNVYPDTTGTWILKYLGTLASCSTSFSRVSKEPSKQHHPSTRGSHPIYPQLLFYSFELHFNSATHLVIFLLPFWWSEAQLPTDAAARWARSQFSPRCKKHKHTAFS